MGTANVRRDVAMALLLVAATGCRNTTSSPPRPVRTAWKGNCPDWSPDGKRIAYDDEGRIVVRDVDGGHCLALTDGKTKDGAPSWSPDGRRIAFVRYGSGFSSGIVVMNADGSGVKRLTGGGRDYLPRWSPDGRQIVFTRVVRGRHSIWKMARDGRGPSRLTHGDPMDANPSWSPDGRRIAFNRIADNHDGIVVMDADGSRQRVLVRGGTDLFLSSPAWSPDGKRIAYGEAPLGTEFAADLWVVGADGKGKVRLTRGSRINSSPSWSPSGKQIVFDRETKDGPEIVVVPADAGAVLNLEGR